MSTVIPNLDESAPAQSDERHAQANSADCTRGRGTRGRGRGRAHGRSLGGGRRGCGRGRGRLGVGETRGSVGAVDPSQGWKVFNNVTEVRLFCTAALERLHVEKTARQLPTTRPGFFALFAGTLLSQCTQWMNENIALHSQGYTSIEIEEVYRYVSVLLLSHLTGLSFAKTLHLLKDLQHSPPDLDRVRYISTHILAYSATGRTENAGSVWTSQRDQTECLGPFEQLAFSSTCQVFLAPVHTLATLDDDLYGTRARDNQVKTISSRKADREGHAADAIADALFRVTLMVRFRRRGVSQNENVSWLLECLMQGRGEHSMHGFILTADRGYGRLTLLKKLLKFRIGTIFVMPEYILWCHPFVGQSFLSPTRDDEDNKSESDTDDDSEPDAQMIGTENVASTDGRQESFGETQEANAVEEGGRFANGPLEQGRFNRFRDRPKKFIINDNANTGAACFYAAKTLKASGSGSPCRAKVTAVAVREHGTERFFKVVRFFYCVPSSISQGLQTWIAVPKKDSITHLLFSKRDDNGRLLPPTESSNSHKDGLELFVTINCTILTIGQRCADWFVLRQFRITGTVAGKLLLKDSNVRTVLGLEAFGAMRASQEMSPAELLDSLAQSWFSSKRSTESMMRGTINEGAVLSALQKKPYVTALFECGMVGKKGMDWLACSPDSVAVIDLAEIGNSFQGQEASTVMASVEIKTNVAESSLDVALRNATVDTVACHLQKLVAKKLVPEQHVGQLIQQMLVLNTNLSFTCQTRECSSRLQHK